MQTPAPAGGRSERAVSSVQRDLEVLGTAPRYYDWIIDLMRPWLGQTVLECGAGSGHVTRRLLAHAGKHVLATEVEAAYLPELQALCRPPRGDAFLMDLEAITQQDIARIRSNAVDTILMVNVLEHIVDDAECVSALARSLAAGGRILIMVPAHQWLYSPLDRIYGHHRRYSRRDLVRVADRAGLQVRWIGSMNLPGAVAWWVIHVLLGRKSLTPMGTRVFNYLVPAIAAAERWVAPPFGQSVVAVMERNANS